MNGWRWRNGLHGETDATRQKIILSYLVNDNDAKGATVKLE